MSANEPPHLDRRRAEAFGQAAENYDRYRPRYPHALIAGLIGHAGVRVLDVGAGTGIASRQLRDAGADVLAVEPDPRMARVAAGHGLRVERARFEDWDPAHRSFDLVVFAQSFHWVQPGPALDKIPSLLRPGGHLVLLSNRVTPVSPLRAQLEEAYHGYLGPSQRPPIDAAHDPDLLAMIEAHGYTIERRHAAEDLTYARDDLVNMALTHSNVLTLDEESRAGLRARLQRSIGSTVVQARNEATAVLATPP
jgi:SAM-dependent methyltransferase